MTARLLAALTGLLILGIPASASPALLWTQYAQANGVLKLTAHTDADPLHPEPATARLLMKISDEWETVAEAEVEPLTAMAAFRVEDWDNRKVFSYRVLCGDSKLEGTIRAEPKAKGGVLKLAVLACIKDEFFPQTNAVQHVIDQDPDLLFFGGDQLYESNAGGEVIYTQSEADIPAAMANVLAKWRKFGLMFKELLKDRPSLIITDDHDVYADDLWGRGGIRMPGNRTTGGYNMEPKWVNLVERVQTWHLPDAAHPGPWGDGILAYYTSLNYGGVSFALLEDRKFKSAPAQVLDAPVSDPDASQMAPNMEVIEWADFDAGKLDQPGLQLLGKSQEDFVRQWANDVFKSGNLAAVLSQSPYANVGNYEPHFGDMDSNGWPQSARDRALRAIAPSKAVMLCGDIYYGTLFQNGIDDWGDGPWTFSVPGFTSNQNRRWKPSVAPQGNAIEGIEGSGNHHDRFGNKLTLVGKADGYKGYGMAFFDKGKREITLDIHLFNDARQPVPDRVPGWPRTIQVE
ncbi:alkaline phosphatase D family protein [Rubripirellula tenax]|nr:alkaline phosphatase D family protein [Rubripirellula tenax]